jgi:hypothetical protein
VIEMARKRDHRTETQIERLDPEATEAHAAVDSTEALVSRSELAAALAPIHQRMNAIGAIVEAARRGPAAVAESRLSVRARTADRRARTRSGSITVLREWGDFDVTTSELEALRSDPLVEVEG